MLAAGAQTNGNQIGENATAFSLWNQGLVDRVRKTNLDKQTFDTSRNDEIASSLQQQFLNNKDKIYNILRNINSKVSSNEDLRSCSAINRDFAQYYLGEATKSTIGNTKMGLPGNFFIPFNLGLNMDGLSGMRLFDAFSITNEVLPSLYTDALQFIINGINHSITDAGWVTSLSSQTYTQFEATGNANEYPTEAVTTRGEADEIPPDTLPNFAGDTPNADFLRKIMEGLGIVEKLQGDNGLGVIQAGDQLSNGGDIKKDLAFASIDLFRSLVKTGVNDIIVTAGNDLYHKTKGGGSLHRSGLAIDFTTSDQTQTVKKLNQYVRGNDKFNYINEYVKRTENGTGDHFHVIYAKKSKSSFAGQQRIQSETFDIIEGLANFQETEIPFKEIQKEFDAFIKKREQDFQTKQETEKATIAGDNKKGGMG